VRKSNDLSFAEVDCWSHAAESLTALSNKYSSHSTLETIERVNRLINAWPPDDTLPAEGYEGVKTIYKKLLPGLTDIRLAAEEEVKYGNILITKPYGAQLPQ
jgi:SAGA-associated factor 29